MAGDAPEKKVIFSKYELGRLLGRGASAKVYLARDVSTGQSVAVKCIAKRKPDLSSTGVVHEIAVMSRLRHPHVVRPIEALATRRHVYLVMELAKGGELFSRLAARGRIHEDLARRYFRQLVSAVGYCHSRGVFHRDIKPENLLLDEHGDLKVSDFGLSGVAPAGSGSLLNTLCGTPAYVAPEILAKKSYEGAGVDVWSCGVVLFVLVAGYLPFNDPNLMAMYRKIYRGEYRSPKWFSPELLRLVSRLLDANPATRITVDGILHDPWFRSGLAEAEWEAIARFHRGEGEEEKLLKAIGEGEERELNAFDIISFSPALDLSGMFERSRGRRERLVCAGPPESVAKRLEAAGKGEGLSVTRKGTRVVMREARGGRVVAAASVHRLAGEMAVVDVVEGGGGAEKRIWETLQAAIER